MEGLIIFIVFLAYSISWLITVMDILWNDGGELLYQDCVYLADKWINYNFQAVIFIGLFFLLCPLLYLIKLCIMSYSATIWLFEKC